MLGGITLLNMKHSPPVRTIRGSSTQPKQGVALCLSGGGYRAMLYHLGSLWCINELSLLRMVMTMMMTMMMSLMIMMMMMMMTMMTMMTMTMVMTMMMMMISFVGSAEG